MGASSPTSSSTAEPQVAGVVGRVPIPPDCLPFRAVRRCEHVGSIGRVWRRDGLAAMSCLGGVYCLGCVSHLSDIERLSAA
eukprot:3145945-Alexandrium_andersonii.AAC.1